MSKTIEADKKYYWRKKRLHCASFEEDEIYLNLDIAFFEMSLSNKVQFEEFKTEFTESEAKSLLGATDFELFEPVEILQSNRNPF